MYVRCLVRCPEHFCICAGASVHLVQKHFKSEEVKIKSGTLACFFHDLFFIFRHSTFIV